jgi:hypothetical protein
MRDRIRPIGGMWLLLLAGCAGPAHRVPGFGVSQRESFPEQVVGSGNSGKKPAPPNMKLDSQEAEVIAQGYLRALSGKTKAEPEPVLYVAPQRQGGAAPAPLPPSVPRN